MIFIFQSGNSGGREMSMKIKTTYHKAKCVFLISEPVHSELQHIIVVAEFEPCFSIIIPGNVFIALEKFIDNVHCILTLVKVRIEIAEEIYLILTPVKIDTVLRFRYKVNRFAWFI